jgi:Fe(3+) dicitrate transport protein
MKLSIKNVLLLSLFSPIGLMAQKAIVKGKIEDESSKQSLAYVNISLNEKLGTYSNPDGTFTLRNIQTGTYELIISSIGYDKHSLSLSVNTEEEIIDLGKINLKPKSIQIPEITISSNATPPLYNPKYISTSNVISKKELELSQPIGTEEALKKVAGVNVAGDMGLSNRLNIGIRGSYPRRSEKLMLLEDGTPIAPAPYLAPEAYYNPPSDRLDGIEIIKGADILAYGSNTMYGVVNYITKRPPAKPTLGVNITGGENGYQSQFITYGGTWNNVGAELQVLNKNFGGFIENSQAHVFNTTAKVFAELGEKSSFYMKVNYHQENAKASYSALTPLTFNLNPKKNPFDADDLSTKRYAADFGYNRTIGKNIVLSTKLYGSEFSRDWWRQENTLVKAKDVKKLVGEDIYSNKYNYLDGLEFSDNDWVRVGNMNSNGREFTRARNRLFRFAGIQETTKINWKIGNLKSSLEIAGRYHSESFINQELQNDSSRYARSGRLIRDEKFTLNSYSAYVKNTFNYGRASLSPIVRYEQVEMRNFNMMSIASNVNNNGSKNFGSIKNIYTSIVPGVSAAYDLIKNENNYLSLYSSVYNGYNAPTAGYGFLAIEGEFVKPATPNMGPSMKPEISLNTEGGIRSNLFKEVLVVQAAYFNNKIDNYYAAGREEAFQSLGSVNISGTEAAVNLNLGNLIKNGKHTINIGVSVTAMQSKILSGSLRDTDLLRAKHTDESKAEILDKINAERAGFDIYYNSGGKDSLVTNENFTINDWSRIRRVDMNFGNNAIANNKVPYIPDYILNYSLNYGFKGFMIGANYNMVGAQYTDNLNMNTETAEGAIGKLPAYATVDANIAYTIKADKNKFKSNITLFVAGKNLTNEVYRASRLHRVSSGIMPGGFRQLNAGVRINL